VGLRAEFRVDGGRLRGPDGAEDHPCAALLGTLAGVSIAFISMRPAEEMYMAPVVGIVCFGIILASWFGGVRYGKGIPAGLVAIAVGTAIAWASSAVGVPMGGMSWGNVTQALSNFGFSVPLPAVGHVFAGFDFQGPHSDYGDSVWHLRSRRGDG
jgi:AGZA family xanthine/uracil permease-like MFS transporter